jgi:XTP/dITP diphosphohydrolase
MINLSTLTFIKILIATKNPGKAREIKDFLGSNFEFVSPSDFKDVPDVEETGKTFEENAALKATKYFEWAGIPAIADDAGLEIDFLNGEPGVKSRRWPSFAEATAGKLGKEKTDQELIGLALDKLKGVPRGKRTAHLRTVGVYFDGKNILTETAAIDGYITEEQTTECQPGYPFRSIFWIPKFEKLYQDLTHEEHEQVNHRKVVYGKLVDKILKLEK